MITYKWIDEEGDDQEFSFNHKNVLCYACAGEGCFYGSPHAGVESSYKETCDCCKGIRVLKEVDEALFDDEDKKMYKEYVLAQKRDAQFMREWQSEVRHGA